MTEKLFYQDSSMESFTAMVLSCEAVSDAYRIVLDRTAFFPEGGGQYADTGRLIAEEGQETEICDVQETDGIVYHYSKSPVKQGIKVTGQLDYEERFSKMQQHTGEHIVSGLVNRHFGYNNVGFHLGSEEVTMDFDGPLTKEQLRQIEREANQAVAENLPIQVLYPAKEELPGITYRSKIEIEGQIRIVQIPGYDSCACCAPHVKYTGQIGIIKLVNAIRYKGGMRVSMLCGFRALEDYNRKADSVAAISNKLSAKQDAVTEAVTRLEHELAEQKDKIRRLQEQYLKGRLKEIEKDTPYVLLFEEELDANAVRRFINDAMELTGGLCAAFIGNDTEGYRYILGTKEKDVLKIAKDVNKALDGRGGGRPPMVQGSLKAVRKEIEKFIEQYVQE